MTSSHGSKVGSTPQLYRGFFLDVPHQPFWSRTSAQGVFCEFSRKKKKNSQKPLVCTPVEESPTRRVPYLVLQSILFDVQNSII